MLTIRRTTDMKGALECPFRKPDRGIEYRG